VNKVILLTSSAMQCLNISAFNFLHNMWHVFQRTYCTFEQHLDIWGLLPSPESASLFDKVTSHCPSQCHRHSRGLALQANHRCPQNWINKHYKSVEFLIGPPAQTLRNIFKTPIQDFLWWWFCYFCRKVICKCIICVAQEDTSDRPQIRGQHIWVIF